MNSRLAGITSKVAILFGPLFRSSEFRLSRYLTNHRAEALGAPITRSCVRHRLPVLSSHEACMHQSLLAEGPWLTAELCSRTIRHGCPLHPPTSYFIDTEYK